MGGSTNPWSLRSMWRRGTVRLTNDCYLITIHAGSGVEHYYRHGSGWIKESVRGRKFKATAEQVLNHLLPALSGVNPSVSVNVEHRDFSESADKKLDSLRASGTQAASAARQPRRKPGPRA